MDASGSGNAVRNDAALMRRIGSGDTSAFQEVMTRFAPRMVRLAYGLLGKADEAEDTAQEALLALWQAAPDWRADATIAAFLRTVTTRKAIDLLRRRKFQTDEAHWERLEDPQRTPEETVQVRQDVEMLMRLVAQLPDRQRTALMLAHFEGLSHREAAATMDIDPEAYASLLARARRSLRGKLAQSEGGTADEQ